MADNDIVLVKALTEDIAEVCAIYESVKGGRYCPWNENYPTRSEAEADVAAGTLYVLKSGEEILGCISIEPKAEDDDLAWQICDGDHREIARVAISPNHQGKGLAKAMVSMLISEMKIQKISSLHLLVAKSNPPAIHTYTSNGFEIIGECYRYDTDFYIAELILN